MDEKLNIYYHIKKEMSKAMQGMDVIGKLKQSTSSVFVRLDLDYGEKKKIRCKCKNRLGLESLKFRCFRNILQD